MTNVLTMSNAASEAIPPTIHTHAHTHTILSQFMM